MAKAIDLTTIEGFENAYQWGQPGWKGSKKMRIITCNYPESFLARIDELVDKGWYYNRSELLRDALRALLQSFYLVTEIEQMPERDR